MTWVVSLPTGLSAQTIWPDMEWIEAFALVQAAEEASEEYEELEEVQAA